MTTVTFTTIPQAFPAGTISSGYHVSILDSVTNAVVSALNVTGTTAEFSLSPGTYVASVQLLDSSSAPLGSAVLSEAFTIAAPIVVELQVPALVTVTP